MKDLLKNIRELIISARSAVVHSVNLIQVATNFEIGRRIVEHEQQGAERAKYGETILKELATSLTDEFGKGFSLTNLKMMRRFYMTYRTAIGQTASDLLPLIEKGQTPSDLLRKSMTGSRKSLIKDIVLAISAQFTLSWSHYVFLMGIKDSTLAIFCNNLKIHNIIKPLFSDRIL